MNHLATIYVTAANAAQAREIAAQFPGGAGMFTSAWTTTQGGQTATHYASSGIMDHAICDALAGIATINDTPDHNPRAVLTAAGLFPVTPDMPA